MIWFETNGENVAQTFTTEPHLTLKYDLIKWDTNLYAFLNSVFEYHVPASILFEIDP